MGTNTACNGHASPIAESVSATAYNHPMLQVQATAKPACKCGKLRPLRKLHAAVGLWLALFVGAHFAICLTGMNPHNYEGTVGMVHRSLAYLPGAVLLLIFVPMLVQAGSGLYLLAKEGVQYSVKRCDRGGKFRFFLQRWSGLTVLVFLLPHIASMRGWGQSLMHHWSALRVVDSTAAGLPVGGAFAYTASAFHPWNIPVANSITILFQLVGILATVFHIANGTWSGAILWKLVQSDRGKTWMGYVSAAVGIALAAMGSLAWYVFSVGPNTYATFSTMVR
jgi:succinate dehydrogenase / fumarate reductase cytochrome b subunit